MNSRFQLLCAWAGPAYIVILVPFWFFMSFLPPTPAGPMQSPESIAELYRAHNAIIILGSSLMIQLCAFGLLWTAAISVQMRRIENSETPILTYAQLVCGTITFVVFLFPAGSWLTAAFRPDRDADIIYALNDWGWLVLFVTIGPVICQSLAIGFAILSDKSAEPIFPRWVGFFNCWCCVLYLPGMINPFFHSGPFAWSGFFVFWIPLNVFVAWIFVMSFNLHRAIKRQNASPVGRVAMAS